VKSGRTRAEERRSEGESEGRGVKGGSEGWRRDGWRSDGEELRNAGCRAAE
jgi:hypothetical protein